MGGPFSFLTLTCDAGASGCSNIGISDLPGWFQAGAIFLIACVLSLVLFVFIFLVRVVPVFRWIFHSTRREARSELFACAFFPPVMGFAAGGISLVYGIQHASLDFALGGGSILGITVLVLFVLFGIARGYTWIPVLGFLIALFLAYYTMLYAEDLLILAGLFFAASCIGFALATRGSSS